MRIRTRLLAGTAITAALLATPGVAAATPAAAPSRATDQPVITALTVSPGHVTVRGLDRVPVTVSVTFSDTVWGDPDSVVLWRTTRGAWDRSAPGELLGTLVRTAGSGSSGTWTGSVQVPSSAHGEWRVGLIGWPGPFGMAVDPRDQGVPDATLSVTGTHRPRMRYSLSPQPLPYPQTRAVARAVMSFDDTRAPITGLTVAFGIDNTCGERIGPSATVRTDRHGVAQRSLQISGPWVTCAWAPFPGSSDFLSSPGWAVQARVAQLGTLTSATPARSTVHARDAVAVNGRATAISVPAGEPVQLQRLVGRHWRTVNTAKVRSSGRFTLTANPPRGRNSYRVALPGDESYAASTSRTFTITGT